MIWDSVRVMTILDLLILVIVGIALYSLIRIRRQAVERAGAIGVAAVLFGLGAVGLFYFADLLLM